MAIYCVSDLHGYLDLYQQIKKFLNPEDIVYFLGDAGDRGPHSWETVKAVYKDPQFIYLKGNHEDMLVTAAKDYYDSGCTFYNFQLLCYNGGRQTFEDLINEPMGETWTHKLDHLPLVKEYINTRGQRIIMTHAGFTYPFMNDVLWNRDHFLDDREDGDEEVYIVHGHTIISHLIEDYKFLRDQYSGEGPLFYGQGYKVDVDAGTVITGRCYLLNLDTWDYKTFYSTDFCSEV